MSSLDTVRSQLGSPLPMPGIERRVCAAVLLSLLLGLSWSLAVLDWQYLERSGALVIIVGVGLTWRDIVQKVGRVERLYKLEFTERIQSLEAKQRTGLLGEAVHTFEKTQAAEDGRKVEEVFGMLRMRIRTIETAIVCTGTLVWGFGSPVLNALWPLR